MTLYRNFFYRFRLVLTKFRPDRLWTGNSTFIAAVTDKDAAASDMVKVATVDDEETKDSPLVPTFTPEIVDAAGSAGVNVVTGDGEDLVVCYALYL